MGSKKNNKNSPVLDSAAPIFDPTPQPVMAKAEARPSANVNAKSKAQNKQDSDPTL